MTRSKLSSKVVLLAGAIGLSMAAFAGQPAGKSTPVKTVHWPTPLDQDFLLKLKGPSFPGPFSVPQ